MVRVGGHDPQPFLQLRRIDVRIHLRFNGALGSAGRFIKSQQGCLAGLAGAGPTHAKQSKAGEGHAGQKDAGRR
jgi:hypothetical protein